VREKKARQQVLDGKTLCVTPFGIDVVGITEALALIGAVTGGTMANQRKVEIAELNEKLLSINRTLRQQIRSPGTSVKQAYNNSAPALNYAPGPGAAGTPAGTDDAASTSATLDSFDAEEQWNSGPGPGAVGAGAAPPDFDAKAMDEMREALRAGRRLLKVETKKSCSQAMTCFKKALMLSRMRGDMVQVRRAVRGLSAAKRGVGDRKGAIADLQEVLDISAKMQVGLYRCCDRARHVIHPMLNPRLLT